MTLSSHDILLESLKHKNRSKWSYSYWSHIREPEILNVRNVKRMSRTGIGSHGLKYMSWKYFRKTNMIILVGHRAEGDIKPVLHITIYYLP
jgi:hypothetical protein